MPVTVSSGVPDAITRSAIRSLAAEIEAQDGAPPLSDQGWAQLDSPGVTHLLARDRDARDGDELVGYAQRDGDGLELVTRLNAVDALLDATAGPALVWAHGRASRLIPTLERRGFTRERELYQLRRPLSDLPADAPLVGGITVRAFEPGRDEDAWLAINAAAFAHHPEQGQWTRGDLDARLAEEWFDPAGFLLAERAGDLVGFHWTKVHPDGAGEVYVLGVSPAAQGLGLGGALLTRGLHLLAARGCPYVLLYVDGDNPKALHLYERDGFTRFDLDVQWARRA